MWRNQDVLALFQEVESFPDIGRMASSVWVRKGGAQRKTLTSDKTPINPWKCRLLSKFPKAHSCNSMLTSINGPCLCCFSQSLDTRRWSLAFQVLSLSNTFSLPDLPTAPDGLTSPSLSFPEGVGERKEKRDKKYRICHYQPSITQPTLQGWPQASHACVGKRLQLGPMPTHTSLSAHLPLLEVRPPSSPPQAASFHRGSYCTPIALIYMINYMLK